MSGPDVDLPTESHKIPDAFTITSRPHILGNGVTLEVQFLNEHGLTALLFNAWHILDEDVSAPGWFARVILRETFEGRVQRATTRLRARAHVLIAEKRRDQLLADVAAAMLAERAAADGHP